MLRIIAVVMTLGWMVGEVAAQADPVRVVATLPVYADLAEKIGGAEVDVSAIASPNEDAHFVRPKPSFALSIRRADLFITTGLDLELWAPVVLDRAGNADVSEGGRGYVTAYTGIELLDIPVSADRSGGDVHIFGNPHVTTDPLRALQVARNITVGLGRVDGWVWRKPSEAGTSYATTRTGHIWRIGSACVARTSSNPNPGSLRLRDTWPRFSRR